MRLSGLTAKGIPVRWILAYNARIVSVSADYYLASNYEFWLWEKSFADSQKFLLFANLAYYCAGIRLISHPDLSKARQFF